jgi:hypothetical protein
LEVKKRLTKFLPDYRELRTIIEDKRRGEFEDRRDKAKNEEGRKRGCVSRKRSGLDHVTRKRGSLPRSKRFNKKRKPRMKLRREPRLKSGWLSCNCKPRYSESGRNRLRLANEPRSDGVTGKQEGPVWSGAVG